MYYNHVYQNISNCNLDLYALNCFVRTGLLIVETKLSGCTRRSLPSSFPLLNISINNPSFCPALNIFQCRSCCQPASNKHALQRPARLKHRRIKLRYLPSAKPVVSRKIGQQMQPDECRIVIQTAQCILYRMDIPANTTNRESQGRSNDER
jgi:hypothetical protein